MQTAAHDIERILAERILRGEYAPGLRLAPVRTLATSFGVNPATVQRAIARLERAGLVVARRGSGVTVLDPRQVSDLGLLPLWLQVLSDRPDEAAALLRDFLEIRRLVAVRLLSRHRAALLRDAGGLTAAVQALADAPRDDIGAVVAADLGVARAMIGATGNLAALAVLNTLGHVLDELPAVAAAMYADLDDNLSAMHAVVAALAGPPDRLGPTVEAALQAIDDKTVARFRAGLSA